MWDQKSDPGFVVARTLRYAQYHRYRARVLKRGVVRSVKWRVRCGSLHCAYARLFLFRHPLTARILALAANCTPCVHNHATPRSALGRGGEIFVFPLNPRDWRSFRRTSEILYRINDAKIIIEQLYLLFSNGSYKCFLRAEFYYWLTLCFFIYLEL